MWLLVLEDRLFRDQEERPGPRMGAYRLANQAVNQPPIHTLTATGGPKDVKAQDDALMGLRLGELNQ